MWLWSNFPEYDSYNKAKVGWKFSINHVDK